MLEEHVMVVPTELFRKLGHFQGFTHAVSRYVDVLTEPENYSFQPRAAMENDPTFKQLIPYVIFRDRKKIFTYCRGATSDEKRLHAKRSIGIGGHINSGETYACGLLREVAEEVAVVSGPLIFKCIGLINDDLTPVGQVHLGIVYITDTIVEPREAEITDYKYAYPEELQLEQYETWSQICLREYFNVKLPQ